MSDYKIVGLQNHNIMLEFDNRRVNFPLPVVDGKYPEGEELTKLLETYVGNARMAAAQAVVTVANEDAIKSLIQGPNEIQASNDVRSFRNRLLAQTDWTQVADCPLTNDQKKQWTSYREKLRNITNQEGFPSKVLWPNPPFPVKNPLGQIMTNADGSPLKVGRPS